MIYCPRVWAERRVKQAKKKKQTIVTFARIKPTFFFLQTWILYRANLVGGDRTFSTPFFSAASYNYPCISKIWMQIFSPNCEWPLSDIIWFGYQPRFDITETNLQKANFWWHKIIFTVLGYGVAFYSRVYYCGSPAPLLCPCNILYILKV